MSIFKSNNPVHPSPLLDSSSARQSYRARWYTAFLTVLLLICLSLHFAMQQESIKQVETLVQQLARTHHWKLGDVRLHMLRGALTLNDLEITQNHIQMKLPHLLLRGHFSARLEDIRLTEIHLQQGRVNWELPSGMSFSELVRSSAASLFPGSMTTLLSSARHIVLDELDVSIQTGDLMKKLTLERLHLEGEGEAEERQWFASSQGQMGLLQWRSNATMSRLDWQDVKAEKLVSFFRDWKIPLQNPARLKGYIVFQNHRISGITHWQGGQHHGRLAWQGDDSELRGSSHTITLHAVNWPAVAVPLQFPGLRDCIWQDGEFNGTFKLQAGKNGWQLSSKELKLRQAVSENLLGQRCWQIDRADISNVYIQWPQRNVRMDQIIINGGEWSLLSELPSSLNSSPWSFDQARIRFNAISVNDPATDIQIHDMYGEAHLLGGRWQLQADTYGDTESAAQWHISAGNSGGENRDSLFRFEVSSSGISPAVFRHLLPPRIGEHAAISGDMQIHFSGGIRSGTREGTHPPFYWYGSGDALIHQFSWERDGWQALINTVRFDHLQFDRYRGISLDALDIGHWALHAPLTPLTEPDSTAEAWQPFWLGEWSVQQARIASGEFSIGWQDAVWLKLDPFTISPLQAGSPIRMQWSGKLLDGDMTATLAWLPWQAPEQWNVSLSLRHALPFAANSWLLQSDLPDFIRGRINLDFNLLSGLEDRYSYNGELRVVLSHADMAQGVQQSENFLRLTGAPPRQLLERLAPDEELQLQVPLQGNWLAQPLTWGGLGAMTLSALKQRYANAQTNLRPLRHNSETLAYIRLHQEDALWPNERARIQLAIKKLKQSPLLVVELVPQLGRHDLDQRFIVVTRRTQQLIEDYLRNGGISPNRIIPLWPQTSHQAGGEAGIRIQLYELHTPPQQ